MAGIYEIRRTPEQGHTARCLAKAMIAAIENIRDDLLQYPAADYYFRLEAQRNEALRLADEYLAEGMTECVCPRVNQPTAGPNPTLAAAARNLAAVRERTGHGVSTYAGGPVIEGEVVNEPEEEAQ